MKKEKNIVINGASGLPVAIDIFFNEDGLQKSVVIYAHGFNGFKDWANFDMIAALFAEEGFVFIKFNFSHNDTAPQTPEDFTNLEAFGNNNYSKQLNDLQIVTDWICDAANPYHNNINTNNISLIGHSMGGGIAIIFASEDKRINQLVTWAAIAECKTPWGSWTVEKMEDWKAKGVQYYENGRTKQQMPLYYQLHEDYEQNQQRLNICEAIKNTTVPVLICHGTNDNAVPVSKAYLLKEAQPNAEMFTVVSDHVFGRSHPWPHDYLPAATEDIVNKTIGFLKQHN